MSSSPRGHPGGDVYLPPSVVRQLASGSLTAHDARRLAERLGIDLDEPVLLLADDPTDVVRLEVDRVALRALARSAGRHAVDAALSKLAADGEVR